MFAQPFNGEAHQRQGGNLGRYIPKTLRTKILLRRHHQALQLRQLPCLSAQGRGIRNRHIKINALHTFSTGVLPETLQTIAHTAQYSVSGNSLPTKKRPGLWPGRCVVAL